MRQGFAEQTLEGLVAERLAPSVLAVRAEGEIRPAGGPVVPGSGEAPTSVLVSAGAAVRTRAVGAVLAGLERFRLLPAAGLATRPWLSELAVVAGTDLVVSTSGESWSPLVTVLSHRRRDAEQQVLDVAGAPAGWTRCGHSTYRYDGDSHGVVAEVVPSGVVVRAPGSAEATAVAALPFDPAGWTLYLGTSGGAVGLRVLAAAEALLDAVGPRRRAAAQARILGELDGDARKALARNVELVAKPSGQLIEQAPGPVSVPDVEVVTEASEESAEPVGPACPEVAAAAGPPSGPDAVPELLAAAAAPPIATTSSAPVSTVAGVESGDAGPVAPPAEPVVTEPAPDVEPGPEPVAMAEPEEPEQTAAAERDPIAGPTPGTDDLPLPVPGADQDGEPEPVAERSPSEPLRAARQDAQPLSIADRGSTAAEQSRFTAAAGDAYGEALASVNGALATWPSLRQDGAPGFKADFVAVCLYLTRDEALRVNEAVRGGVPAPIAAHVPCLASGIRRLPTHRRAVLRQTVLADGAEYRSEPGALLTEPGFLTASMDLDITVPGAELDVLIWPATARRTSELLAGRVADEAVFVAGARFKALAVRTAEADADAEDGEGPQPPRVAALLRELAPGEHPSGSELDDRDLAVLAKLDRILARRQQRTVRLVDEPGLVGRLTSALAEWRESVVDPCGAGRTAAAS